MMTSPTRHRLMIATASLVVLGFAGCGSGDVESGPDSVAAAAVSAIAGAVVSGAAANPGQISGQLRLPIEPSPSTSRSYAARLLDALGGPSAQAMVSQCGASAMSDGCSAGTKSAQYIGCGIGNSGLTYSGTVTLSYNNGGCALGAGGVVTRTLTSFVRTGLSNSTIQVLTDVHTDYRGNSLGGGTRLSSSGSAYSVDFPGTRQIKTLSNGNVAFDISTRTLPGSSLTLSGLGSSITVNGSGIEVIHNLSHFIAGVTASSVVFDTNTCCYPVSGSLTLNYSNDTNNPGTVTFSQTCGSAAFTKNGTTTPLTLNGCQ